MTEEKFEEFSKELKINDIFKAYYSPTNRDIVVVVMDIAESWYYIKLKCIMDNDSHKRNSMLGETFTMNLLSHSVWDLTKL